MPVIRYRRLTRADIQAALGLSTGAGWNQTADDWAFFVRHNPDGCFAAVSNGVLAGTGVSVRYGPVAWLSLLLVGPEYRGRGVGTELMRMLIEANRGVCRTLKLDATPAGLPVYRKLGFNAELELVRYIAPSLPAAGKSSPRISGPGIEEITDFDEEHFGCDRGPLIRNIAGRDSQKLYTRASGAGISGYALARAGRLYYQIGPLTAVLDGAAAELLSTATSDLAGSPAVIDLPAEQPLLFGILRSLGFEEQRRFIRMYLGEPLAQLTRVSWAAAGPEYG